MRHKTKSNAWVRKYLKVMRKHIVTAFEMGYEDGATGKERQAPPFPEEIRPGNPAYGVAVFAQEMYNKGFELGEEGAK